MIRFCAREASALSGNARYGAYDFFKRILSLFQFAYELNLRPRSVEVLPFAFGFKIAVAVDIISEKAHAAFERHDFGSSKKQPQFVFAKRSARTRYKAFGSCAKEVFVEAHFRQIPLVFVP